MEHLFPNGSYGGNGHWTDQKAEGRYRVRYSVEDGPAGGKVHRVERDFLKEDGSTLYEERTTVTFEATGRGGVAVTIQGPQGAVSGSGYHFDHECHYDIDVTADNHLEFTFHTGGARIHGLGSATNGGNRTYWRESPELL